MDLRRCLFWWVTVCLLAGLAEDGLAYDPSEAGLNVLRIKVERPSYKIGDEELPAEVLATVVDVRPRGLLLLTSGWAIEQHVSNEAGPPHLVVQFPGSVELPAASIPVGINRELDMAVVMVPAPQGADFSRKAASVLVTASGLGEGDDLLAIGDEKAAAVRFSREGESLRLDGAAGLAGAPIVNRRGELVGFVVEDGNREISARDAARQMQEGWLLSNSQLGSPVELRDKAKRVSLAEAQSIIDRLAIPQDELGIPPPPDPAGQSIGRDLGEFFGKARKAADAGMDAFVTGTTPVGGGARHKFETVDREGLEVVRDWLTRREWLQWDFSKLEGACTTSSPDTMTYLEAENCLVAANEFGVAGKKDWRIRTLDELLQLIDEESRGLPATPVRLFLPEEFRKPSGLVWSADSYADGGEWAVCYRDRDPMNRGCPGPWGAVANYHQGSVFLIRAF